MAIGQNEFVLDRVMMDYSPISTVYTPFSDIKYVDCLPLTGNELNCIDIAINMAYCDFLSQVTCASV